MPCRPRARTSSFLASARPHDYRYGVAMRLALMTALVALAAPAMGCTGAVSDPTVPGDAEPSTTSAVVIVERTVDPTGGPRAGASARFVRVSAPSSARDALRTIGAAVDLPAQGSCVSLATLAGVAPGAPVVAAPWVELVDVGAVSLEVSGHETHLTPRQLPDVTDVVSGVVYARAADSALFPSSARYLLHVSGGPDVDPFDVAAAAPADPADVRIGGEDSATGVVVAAGAPIAIEWTPDGTDDALYVDVQPAAVRCALQDGQHSAEGLARTTVPATVLDETGTLVVHRMHREALVARGLEGGEVRFDFSRSVAYVRR